MSSFVMRHEQRKRRNVCVDNNNSNTNTNTKSELINNNSSSIISLPLTIVTIAQQVQPEFRQSTVQDNVIDRPMLGHTNVDTIVHQQQHYYGEKQQPQMYPRHQQQRQYNLYNQPIVIPADNEFSNNNHHPLPPVGEIVIFPRTRGTSSNSAASQSTTSDLRDSVNSSSESNSTSQKSKQRKQYSHSRDQLELHKNNSHLLLSKIDISNRELIASLQRQQSMIVPSSVYAQPMGLPVQVVVQNPLKIVRPVPQRAAEAFYRTAHELQLPSNDIQDAIVQSNEWHRKWTHQDETPALYTNTNAIEDDDDTFEIVFETNDGTTSLGQSHTELSLDTLSPKEQQLLSKNKRNASSWLLRQESHEQHYVVDNKEDEDVESDDTRQRYPNNGSHWVDLLAADREGGARNPSPDADETVVSTYVDEDEQSLYVGSPSRGDEILNNPIHEEQGSSSSPPPTSYTDCPFAYLERSKRDRRTDDDNDNVSNSSESDEEDFLAPLLTHRENYNQNENGTMDQQQDAWTAPVFARPTPRLALDDAVAPVPQGPVSTSLVRPLALRPRDHIVEKSLSTRSSRLNGIPPVQHIIQDDRSLTSDRSWSNRRSMSPLTVSTMGGGNNDSITSSTKYRSANKKHKMIRSQSDDPIDYPNNNTFVDEYHPNSQEEQEGAMVNIIECDDADIDMQVVGTESTWILCPSFLPSAVSVARDGIFNQLAISHGNTDTPLFAQCLQVLQDHYRMEYTTRSDYMENPYVEDGNWLTLTKPTFFGNLGDNDNGDPMYTLGRMSFDMFSPTSIVCSLQGTFNSVKVIGDANRRLLSQTNLDSEYDHYCAIPKKLQNEVDNGESVMRTYDIVTAFTIETSLPAYPKAPNKDVSRPIRGFMTTHGYTLPDPDEPKRFSVWITGGKIEPANNTEDQVAWNKLFASHPPKHDFSEKAKLLAVKLLMGATVPDVVDPTTGAMEYKFTRPLGGHGTAYVDTLYCDESLRIVKGHRGTVFVFTRMPEK